MKKLLLFACAIAVGVALTSMSFADVVDDSGAGFAFPDNDANGNSSDIVIDGVDPDELVTDVQVALFDVTHTWVGDLTITIGNTQSGSIDLMHRTGQLGGAGAGDSSDLGDTYIFVDFGVGADWWATAAALGGADVIPGGVYGATTVDGAASVLSAFFAGDSVNDTWTLFVSDNADGDVGSIGGWGITLISSPIPEPASLTLIGALGIACVIRRRRQGLGHQKTPTSKFDAGQGFRPY